MAVLPLDSNQTPNQQQPTNGLLGNMSSPDQQMMMMAMVGGLLGGRRRKNSEGLKAMYQMEQADAAASRQQQMDALRFKEFEMRQNEYNRGAAKYQLELNDYNKKTAAEKGLLDSINGDPGAQPATPAPQGASQQPQPTQPMADQKPIMPEAAQPNQPNMQPQVPMMEKPPIDPALENPMGMAAQNAMSQNIPLPEMPSAKDLQNAFLTVKPTDNNGNISQGAVQKKKLAGYLVQMGQSSAAMQLLKSDYGQPVKVTNTNGEHKLIQINSDGEIKEVQGYGPAGADPRIPAGYMPVDQNDLNKGVKPIPGGPVGKMTPEQAGKAQLYASGLSSAKTAQSLIVNQKTDKIDYNLITTMYTNMPGTDGAMARSNMEDAVANVLYIKTGAAATPGEVQQQMVIYMPRPWDNEKTVRDKLDRFNLFMEGAMGRTKAQPSHAGSQPSSADNNDPLGWRK